MGLEPQQQAVAVRLVVRMADGPVVMLHVEPMQLKNKNIVPDQPFVFVSAVRAFAAEKALIPPAAGFDIGHGNEGLWAHG
jgi:hypothetical protein